MQHTIINDDAWINLGTSLVACIIQGSGDVEVFVGAAAPDEGSPRMNIQSGDPVEIPHVDAFGGGVWVRSVKSAGAVTYAVA